MLDSETKLKQEHCHRLVKTAIKGNNIRDSANNVPYHWKIIGSRGDYPLHRGKHLLVAVELLVFADESGTHGNPKYCLVVGYIGSPRQWKQFDREWHEVLSTYGVAEFHSVDFFGKLRWQSSQSPYHGWNDRKSRSFLERLTSIIRQYRRRIRPVGCTVEVPAFNSFAIGERRYLSNALIARGGIPITSGAPMRPPYQLAFTTLLYHAMQAANDDTKVNFIFDLNSLEYGLAIETFNRIRKEQPHPDWSKIGEIRFARSEERPGLQAADLYAYLWHRWLTQGSRLGNEAAFARRVRCSK